MAKLRHTLAFKLTLWYAAIFVFCAAGAFVSFYLLIENAFRQRIDVQLSEQADRLKDVYERSGTDTFLRAGLLQTQAGGEDRAFLRLLYPSGIVFATSNMRSWRSIRVDRLAVDEVLRTGENLFRTDKGSQGFATRILYAQVDSEIIMQLGLSLESETRLLQTFRRIFTVTMAAMLIVAVAVGWFMARRALSGVESITRTARRISPEDLDTRVPVKNRHDEIDLLAVTFNQMLDRIRNLVTGVRRMNDDIAHDLRSPLTRMRGLAEVTLTQEAREEAYTHLAASTIEECDRLLAMISTMLTISRTEDGVTAVERRPVDVSKLVLKACDLFQTSAEDKNIVLSARVEERIVVNGDQSMLQRMVANLIDNAIRYTDPEGCIDVSLNTAEENQAILAVTDTGIGITLEDQALVFERFYRGDRSRSQEGAGLGLSLALAVARAHGGDIGLYSTPGQGSTFTVRLPSMRGTDQP